jgi:hypothetical protein|tara:strand:+ start:4707 stop:5240 length:534 start_codon:yes stop_codon:yes gene_type:complete
MIVLAIDPGLVNLGFAIIIDGKFAECGVAKISRKKELVDELQRFADAMKGYGPFDCVAIERQMRANMRVISTHLFHLFANAKIVSPQSIKRYFNYSGMRSYKDRKKKGVELFKKLCRENKQMKLFEKVLRGRNKIDDVADAALIGYYIFAENKVKRKQDHGDVNQWVNDNLWIVSPS